MDSKKIAYILMTFSFVFIVSGSVSSFLIGLKNDRNETYKRMDDVSNSYEVFSTNVSVFENVRDELYNNILGNVYYDTMYTNDLAIKNKLSNYENLVDELEKNTNNLNKLCDDAYYPESKINNICLNYKSIYEQVINYFVSDIKTYNKNVVSYNNYQATLGTGLSVIKYNTNKKYIDCNNDGKYDGKEE